MDFETAWQALCVTANLHADTSMALLAEPLRPSLCRVVDRFVSQSTPRTQRELAARQEQESILMAIVTAVVELGDSLRDNPTHLNRLITVAAELAVLNLNQADRLKFDLEIAWIVRRARR